ncbi:gamma-glutamylcyclotransferase family protein [Paenibacillus caseinilyticus]|uniref:Gamma-glutamyl cyclotransferase n=1 Tax=Paenibacillus mucilaginosus K02 TaxID=997761 RepID=I0BSR3_9BACL|nr:gamma-glutamylcyclotransferase family protein [Paenibacillus mucilaginosus]AFH65410.1 gamma-glutamyl cyclotransferase [Paenibacillus mucilaginosus K02]
MIRVFVYGTLLQGESNHGIVAPYLLSVRPGAVRGTLYDAGSYPALVLSGEAVSAPLVEGEWLVVEPKGLQAMDELEEYYGPDADNDYDRVWIRDALREEREGWVYVWRHSRGCPPLTSCSWRRHLRRKEAGEAQH